MSTQAELRQRGVQVNPQGLDETMDAPSIADVTVEEDFTVFAGDQDRYLDTEKIEHDIIATGGSLLVPATIDVWAIIRKSAINLVLPFINGMMLGFGEILAHEIGFKYRWAGAKVVPPQRKQQQLTPPRVKSSYL